MKHSVLRFALVGAALFAPVALASSRSHARRAASQILAAKHRAAKRAALRAAMTPRPLNQTTLPRYVSLATIQRLQREYRAEPLPALQPFWKGQALKRPMSNLLTGPTLDLPPAPVPGSHGKVASKKRDQLRFAQGFPRPIPPAAVPSGRYPATNRRGARTVVPNWVRYPLEFQLCGIGLGTKAVDKDRFNRIDRYGIFALHGNPTAVVIPIVAAAGAAGGGADAGGPSGGALGAPGGAAPGGGGRGGLSAGGGDAGGGGAAAAAPTTGTSLTLRQTPPGVTVLFPQSQLGGLPDWALAITVDLKPGEVEWLYKRDTFAMGFVVDKLGYCEAIIAAGPQSPIARTQQEDPLHTVKLGDDFRKVVSRYGYPDDTVPLGPDPVASANSQTGTPGAAAGGGGGAKGGGLSAPGGGGAPSLAGPGGAAAAGGSDAGGGAGAGGAGAGAGGATNGAFRTYDLRYDQTYNTVFTVRNNRVVRIVIFGDPDFFTDARRNSLRTRY